MSGRVSRTVWEGSPGHSPGPRSHEHHALPLTESVRSDRVQASFANNVAEIYNYIACMSFLYRIKKGAKRPLSHGLE